MAYDLLIKNGHRGRRHGQPGAARRRRGQGRQDRRDRQDHRRCPSGHQRGGLHRGARLRRSAHPLRCADLLGSGDLAVVLARRDLGRDGQLRRRHRACRPASREVAMRDLVNVEGIPFEVLEKGITWDWETFPEFLRCGGAARLGAQSRLSRAADAVPPLRDGRGLAGARRDPGRDRADQGAARRGGGRRRARLLDHQHETSISAIRRGRWPAATPAPTSSRPIAMSSRRAAPARSSWRSTSRSRCCRTRNIPCSICS